MRQVRDAHRHAELASELGRERHVLVRELEREVRRLERALQELPAEAVERALAAERALPHRRPQLERIDAGLDAHREHFGERGLDHVARAVVHELRDRARADRRRCRSPGRRSRRARA